VSDGRYRAAVALRPEYAGAFSNGANALHLLARSPYMPFSCPTRARTHVLLPRTHMCCAHAHMRTHTHAQTRRVLDATDGEEEGE
jgi:hypothetical protein